MYVLREELSSRVEEWPMIRRTTFDVEVVILMGC